MKYLSYLCNIFIVLFWLRIWFDMEEEFFFNPLITGTVRAADTILNFLRPVLMLPAQLAAMLVVLVAFILKSLLLWRFHADWSLEIGGLFAFIPNPRDESFLTPLFFSAAQTALFMLRLWSAALFIKFISNRQKITRASESLEAFTRPLSWVSLPLQTLVLLLFHFMVVTVIAHTDLFVMTGSPLQALGKLDPSLRESLRGVSPFQGGAVEPTIIKTAALALLSLLDGLMFMTRALLIFIIGNLVAALLGSHSTMVLCAEGAEMVMGRFRRARGVALGFDFTPLIFFFAIDLIYRQSSILLYKYINSVGI